MSPWRKLMNLLPARRRAMERDIREELESLSALAEEEGSRHHLGNLTLAAEDARAAGLWNGLEQVLADVRYAGRIMKRNPGLVLTAILSLALGIGGNTAIFGLMNAILLKTLPVHDPATLVVMTSYSKDGRIGDFGYGDYLSIRGENRSLSGVLAASRSGPVSAGIGEGSQSIQRKIVSGNYFSVLEVAPSLGRVFRDDEEEQPLAVLSDGWWRRSFGSSADVLGRQIDLDGKAFTVVGVAPPEFLGETVGEPVDAWVTMAMMPSAMRAAPGYTWLNLMARLRPGVSREHAAFALARPGTRLPNRFIERIELEPGSSGSSGLRNTFSAPLKVLMGVVAVALLIACSNLAGLLLARAASRQREIATRLAIGASRMRVFRQLITESLLLSAAGGALGLAVALWGERVLLKLVSDAGRTIAIDLRPDLPVLLFNLATSLLAGVLFGAAPAIHALRESVAENLKASAPATFMGKSGLGFRGGLIGAQVGLSMMLLVVGGLFVRTLQNLKQQDLGFRPEQVLSAQFRAEGQHRPAATVLIPELLRSLDAVPGVASACLSLDGTLGDANGIEGFSIAGIPIATAGTTRAGASWVSPRYFETLRIPLMEGREFTPADTAESLPVVVISQALARQYLGSDHAIGRNLGFQGKSYTIVGVAHDAKHGDLRKPVAPFVYFAALQGGPPVHSLEVRTRIAPAALAADIRRVLQDVDPKLKVVQAAPLEQLIDLRLAREVLVAHLAGFFAGLTLILVVIGIYGTVAYSIARRRKEIGIRIALGAQPGDIMRVVLGQIGFAMLAGSAAGAALAAFAGRVLAFLLYGLKGVDLQTIGGAGLILCLAALAAGYLPVRRALRLDPTATLRLD